VTDSPASEPAPATPSLDVSSAAAESDVPHAPPHQRPSRNKRARAALVIRKLGAFTAREKDHLVSEILQVRGLMPLMMKPRNGQRWSSEDKAELVKHLKRLSKLSPYLVIGVMPGGFLLLPALAWWLDRRRNRTASRRSTES
jgi:hypothetical protein